jgi:TolB protein
MKLGTAFTGLVLLASAAAAAETFAVPEEVAPSNSEESSWSPDGRRIAFDSARNGKLFNVYSLELSTGKVTRLTKTPANDITPAWSPDGRRIAFTSDRTGHNEIWVMNADGSAARRVTRDGSDSIHPFWSPDGTTLIYCSARDNPDRSRAPEGEVYEIYTIRPNGSRRQRLTSLGGINTYPNFSPDGRRIVFRKVLGERNSEIWIINADGRHARNLTNHPAFDGWPHWSPDGRRIVFASNRRTNGEDYDLYVMSSDGSGLQRLTDIPGRITSPKWSPDGSRITFDQSARGRVRILVIPAP